MIAALLVLQLVSDAALLALFFAVRSQRAQSIATPSAPAHDIAEQIGTLRLHAEQASAELARQQLQLRRLLNGPTSSTPAAVDTIAALTPAAVLDGPTTPSDTLQLVRAGVSPTTAAARAGVSLEEIRLALAMGGPRASA
jgi:hypothetical protein